MQAARTVSSTIFSRNKIKAGSGREILTQLILDPVDLLENQKELEVHHLETFHQLGQKLAQSRPLLYSRQLHYTSVDKDQFIKCISLGLVHQ